MRSMPFLVALLALGGCGSATGGPGAVSRPKTGAVLIPRAAAASPRPGSSAEIEHGPRTRRWVALTFDADMTRVMLARLRSGAQRSWYDAEIVHELERTRTPASIFLTGLWASAYPGVVRALSRDPLFELENHSVDHSGWLAPCYGLPVVRGARSKRAEIEGAASTIRHLARVAPRYFRFPGGCHDRTDLRRVAAAGQRAVGWDVVSGDPFQADPAVIERAVLSRVQPGSIVVMHLVGAPNAPATGRALPTIITQLRARGFSFVTLRQMLGAAANPR